MTDINRQKGKSGILGKTVLLNSLLFAQTNSTLLGSGKARRKGMTYNPSPFPTKKLIKRLNRLVNKPTNKRLKIKLARKVYVQQQIKRK